MKAAAPAMGAAERMQILLAADASPLDDGSGAERVLQEHAKGLARRGHQVGILFRRAAGSGDVPEEWEGCRLFPYRASRRGHASFLLSTMHNVRSALRDVWKVSQPQIVNLHQPFTGLGMLRDLRKHEVPIVYSFHSPAPAEYLTQMALACTNGGGRISRWWRRRVVAQAIDRVEGLVLARSDAIILESDWMRKEMQRWHPATAKQWAVRVQGGVDLDRFRPAADRLALREPLELPASKKVVLTVRNLEPRTGVENLLLAAADLARLRSDFLLVIAGDGPLFQRLETLTRRLGLQDHVRLLGFVQDEALPDLYRTADLYVQPDTELQGFGLPVVEALACDTRVMALRTGGVCEILEELGNECFFSSSRPRTMAEELHEALDGLEPCSDLRYHRFASKHFSWDRAIEQLECIFRQVCVRATAGTEYDE